MRKLVLMMSISVDGFMEGPNRELDWQLVDVEVHNEFNQVLAGMGAFLDGRVTYEMMAAYWPTADRDPSSTEPEIAFSRIWREMPKIVYSRTLERADWNTTVVHEVVPDEVRKMKEQPGGDLAVGGADLAAEFMRHDLIDEYRLYVHPVAIGAGKRLFREPAAAMDLRLLETRAFANGVVLLHYERVR